MSDKKQSKPDANTERDIVTPNLSQLQVIEAAGVKLLSSQDLTNTISKSWNAFESFDRAFMAEARKRLLPLFDEVKERIDNKISVNNCDTFYDFCESVHIDPAKVRVWRMRAARELEDGSTENPHDEPVKLTKMEAIIAKLPNVKAKADYIEKLNKGRLNESQRKEIAKELESRASQLNTWAAQLRVLPFEGKKVTPTKGRKSRKGKKPTEPAPNYEQLAKKYNSEHPQA